MGENVKILLSMADPLIHWEVGPVCMSCFCSLCALLSDCMCRYRPSTCAYPSYMNTCVRSGPLLHDRVRILCPLSWLRIYVPRVQSLSSPGVAKKNSCHQRAYIDTTGSLAVIRSCSPTFWSISRQADATTCIAYTYSKG